MFSSSSSLLSLCAPLLFFFFNTTATTSLFHFAEEQKKKTLQEVQSPLRRDENQDGQKYAQMRLSAHAKEITGSRAII